MSYAIDNPAMTLPETGAGERVSPFARLLPSLTDMAVLVAIVILFGVMSGAHSLLNDCDTGWHIRTGQWILTNHQVPRQDIFSYTMPGAPWFAWEWLWDIAFAIVYNFSGLAGVVLTSLMILCVTMALAFRLTRRKCNNVLVAFGVSTIGIAGSSMHWLARPHLFTLLFGVIFLWMMECAKESLEAGNDVRAHRLLWLLPVLSVLWTNLHAGFILGVMITGCYAAGETAAWMVAPAGDRPAAFGRAWRFLLTSVGCFAASLLNPYSIALHKHMFTFLHDRYSFTHIMEYQSVSFHSTMAWTWEVMMLLAAIAAFRELQRKQFTYFFMIVLWGHLGLIAGRNVPIFMLMAAPIAAKNLAEMFALVKRAPVARWVRQAGENFERLAAEIDHTDRIPRLHLTSILAVVAVAVLIYAPNPPEKFRAEFNPNGYPAKALAFIGGPGVQNRIFTHDEWGDYILYSLYPTKVFVDGRSDMYGDTFCLNYMDILDVKYDWEHSLAQYRVDTIVLPTTTSLASALKESRNWRVVYDDHLAIVFRQVGAAPLPGEKVSTVQVGGGTGRDRKVTKSEGRDLMITKTST